MSRRDLGFWTAAARNSCEGCSSPFLGLSLDTFGTRVAAAITDGWKTGSLWHGIRVTVITDNGPQFACLEFAQLDCTLSLEFERFTYFLCTEVKQQKEKGPQFPIHSGS